MIIIIRRSGDAGKVKRKNRRGTGENGNPSGDWREQINLAKISQGKAEGDIKKTNQQNKKHK